MTKQTTALVAVLFALALALGAGIGRADPAPSSESTVRPIVTQTTAAQAVFVTHGETVVGPVVIVADEPRLDGGQLVINFDVAGLAPTADAASVVEYAGFGSTLVVLPEDLDTVFLDQWSLKTTSGEIPGVVANPAARAARFEVGADFDPASIIEVAITSYALRTPFDATVALAPGAEFASVAPGVSAHLLAVTEQDNTIVQVELVSERDFNLDAVSVSGSGAGWVAGVREAEGRPRWNLTFDSPQVPSPIQLDVAGSIWITVEQRVPVIVPEFE